MVLVLMRRPVNTEPMSADPLKIRIRTVSDVATRYPLLRLFVIKESMKTKLHGGKYFKRFQNELTEFLV